MPCPGLQNPNASNCITIAIRKSSNERTDVLDVQSGGAQGLLAGNLMTAAGDVDKIVTAQKIRTLRIADRDNIFVQTFLARALFAGDDQAGGAVGQHDAVKEPDRISDQA